MKKILFSLLGRALLLVSLTALASCNDDKTEPSGGTPSVAIGEITPQSDRLTFALTLRDAEKAFYLPLSSRNRIGTFGRDARGSGHPREPVPDGDRRRAPA